MTKPANAKPDIRFMVGRAALEIDPTEWCRTSISPAIADARPSVGVTTGWVRQLPSRSWVVLIPHGRQATAVLLDTTDAAPVERRLVLSKTGNPTWFRDYETAAQELEGVFKSGGNLPTCWRWDPPPSTPALTDLVPVRVDSGLRRLGVERFSVRGWTIQQDSLGVEFWRGHGTPRRAATIEEAVALCRDQ